MDSFSMNIVGNVPVFGFTTVTPDFLLKHGISYTRKGHSTDAIVETGQNGKQLVYLLDGPGQQLRVVTFPEPTKRYAHLDGKSESFKEKVLDVIASEDSSSEFGELLYLAHYEDGNSRAALLGAAYDAALGSGVTHATARWFSQYFVQDAFFSYGMAQEFTDKGIFRGTEAFDSSHKTIKKQLNLLQQAGVMAYESLPKEASFYLRFNRQSMPGIKQEKLPRFFNTFLF
jgi:hypothetical protein